MSMYYVRVCTWSLYTLAHARSMYNIYIPVPTCAITTLYSQIQMYNRISFIIIPVLIIVNVSRQPPVTELNLALRVLLYCACC